MAGYSGTPLIQKLGLKGGCRLSVLGGPDGFLESLDLPESVTVATSLAGKSAFDVIVCFVMSQAELLRRFDACAKRLDPAGGFWVAWPKKASGVPTDLTEDRVREVALAAGLVDNKVCAIDGTWSGLRLVGPVKDRPSATKKRITKR